MAKSVLIAEESPFDKTTDNVDNENDQGLIILAGHDDNQAANVRRCDSDVIDQN